MQFDKVFYKGSISDDGKLITGSWTINVELNGSFRMVRAAEQTSREKIVTAHEVEAV